MWPILLATALFRAIAAWSAAELVLHDPLTRERWWLVPFQDLINALIWIAGFFGNTIVWRGERFQVREGKLHHSS